MTGFDRSSHEAPGAGQRETMRRDVTFRDGMANLPSPVSVLTLTDAMGRDCGLTVSSVVSLSLNPPMVLVCVRRESYVHDALEVADGWAINLLGADQGEVASYFARHRHPGDRDTFDGRTAGRGEVSGAVHLRGATLTLDCARHELVQAGDHVAAVGIVRRLVVDDASPVPLVYWQRRYGSPRIGAADRG